jgi:hypothetical protein
MSSERRKPPKRMFKTTDRASRYEHDLSPTSRIKRVSLAHEGLLKAIETVLVTGWRSDPRVDDPTAASAVQGAATGREPDDPLGARLTRELLDVRARYEDATDVVWQGTLRIVAESIDRHSTFQPGDVAYLTFAASFLPEIT